MGWSFRRSVKFGPLRVNLSRSGVSLSGGVRGARVNVGPRGTYVTLSAAGFQYRRKLDGAGRDSSRSGSPLVSEPNGTIATAPVAELQAVSSSESMAEIAEQLSRVDWFVAYAVVACVGLLATVTSSPVVSVVVGVAALALGVPIYRWSNARRTARLIYDVDDEQLLERLALAAAVGEALNRSNRLWHIWWSRATSDQKRNAGASHLIQRTVVRSQRGTLKHIESNVEPWSVPAGPQRLLFLPDRLLVREGSSFAGVAYGDLTVRSGSTQFIETEGVPRDSQVVGTTWRFVNKSGGPDRRFNDNRQIPMARYGELVLEAPGGLRVVLNTSSVDAGEAAARALRELQRVAEAPDTTQRDRAKAAETFAKVDTRADPVIEVMRSSPGASAADRAFAFAVMLKYIASADRRLLEEERLAVMNALVAHADGDADLLNAVNARIESIKPDAEMVGAALTVVRRLEPAARKAMLDAAWGIAGADGKVTPKELERLKELGAGLAVEVAPA